MYKQMFYITYIQRLSLFSEIIINFNLSLQFIL